MEAHGSPGAAFLQKFTGMVPDALAEPLIKKAGVDRLAALSTAIDAFATHHLPLAEAPEAYRHFQKKEEGVVKVVFQP
ncbi:threonine dehydrogenase-like Zn-dependent dehydrogenase [Nocardioides aromaticivorans]|uniref:Threonine dehydrogenase-like Zn-dependent dehydrogenase n=1 Tax=Nocardioides aromaticivorans TaxID=200618 RepID=A0A7Y9ZIQ2_9ACTN|nr:hypothetical protein [Nocardioides aromaticivorans]NYI45068.1 threonine dehydrogenase-like Zn-dependent dehydrogenase [Nocardioides aromaticivorans]